MIRIGPPTGRSRDLLLQAVELQRRYSWALARFHLDDAIEECEENVFAHVNRAICSYHLGEIARESTVLSLLARLEKPHSVRFVPIAMFGLAARGRLAAARELAFFLQDDIVNGTAFPRIPIALLPEGVVESSGLEPFYQLLRALAADPSCRPFDRKRLIRLAAMYATNRSHRLAQQRYA